MNTKLPPGIEALPSGRYRAVTWNRYTKSKGPSKTWDDPFEAEAWKARIELDMYRAYKGQGIEMPAPRTVTFAEYTKTWPATGAVSTRRTDAAHLKAAAKAWPTQKITDVTPVMIKAMLADMESDGLSSRTRALRVTSLRKLFAAAVEDGLRLDNPAAGVRPPKNVADIAKHRPVSPAELDKIMAELPEWTHAAVLLSRDSGLRIGEVCGLPWHRVDLVRARVTVSDVVQPDGTIKATPKGVAVLSVPLSARTVVALTEHLRRWPGGKADRVFANPSGYRRNVGKPLSPQTLRQHWNRAVQRAGIDHPAPRFHDLRHSHGHAMADSNAPIHVIQAMLRHASVTTTRKYMGVVTVEEMARWMEVADTGRHLHAV
jgi:integrase